MLIAFENLRRRCGCVNTRRSRKTRRNRKGEEFKEEGAPGSEEAQPKCRVRAFEKG